MPVTQRFYPSFFGRRLRGAANTAFSNSVSTDYTSGQLTCSIGLYNNALYNASHNIEGDLGSFSPLANSTKSTVLNFSTSGDTIKFWLDEVLWSTVADGLIYNSAIVWSGTDILIMHIDFGQNITVNGPFRLKMSTNGEAKIDFNP